VLNKPNKTANSFAAFLVALLAIMPPYSANAAFLRLGPFDFEAQTSLEGIYTSNVEGERPDEQTAEPVDYYFVWSFDLGSTADFLPGTTFNVDTGIAIEKHLNRPDLDNSEAPFGRFALDFETVAEPIYLSGMTRYERSSESVEDKYVPASLKDDRKRRQTGTDFEYGAIAGWDGDLLDLSAEYTFLQERYDSYDFFEEEKNEENLNYLSSLELTEFLSVGYKVEYSRTDQINVSDGVGPTEKTESITLDFTQNLLERPQLTYSVGVQREYIEEETDGWEIIHNATLSEDVELSPSLRLAGEITYKYEDNPEDDDIAFTYGLVVEQELSRRHSHAFRATREPVDTLGSTTETDETKYGYTFSIADFLLPGISASFGTAHTISRPVDDDTERTWENSAGLTHTVQINSRLSRVIGYTYMRETSNLEYDPLEEHRVDIAYVLDL